MNEDMMTDDSEIDEVTESERSDEVAEVLDSLTDEALEVGDLVFGEKGFAKALQRGDSSAGRLLQALKLCTRTEDAQQFQDLITATGEALEKLAAHDLWMVGGELDTAVEAAVEQLATWSEDESLVGVTAAMLNEIQRFNEKDDYTTRSQSLREARLSGFASSIRALLKPQTPRNQRELTQ
jgi:hypothetical protein